MRQKYLFSYLLSLLAMFLINLQLQAQQRTITGRVLDGSDNSPMPGVSIVIEGTTQGTVSDVEGNYTLDVSQGDVLVYAFVGFLRERITISSQSVIDVQMTPDITALEEVVVVGYGVQERARVTGSIAKVDGARLMEHPVPSFEAGLQGKAPGVQITQSSGIAGAGSQIRVRGNGSITAGGDPLIVIDGMPIANNEGDRRGAANTNPLATINPNDIESIEILKDASAAAIYGSRGANGVILITTKRGKSGKPQFNLNYRVTASEPTSKLNMLNGSEYLGLMQEAYENDAIYGNGNLNQGPRPNLLQGLTWEEASMNNTDWQDEVIRMGISNAVDFSVNQGTEKFKSYIGLSYSDENSFLDKNNFERLGARANFDYSPTNRMTISSQVGFTHNTNNIVPVAWNGGHGTAISRALPYFPLRDPDSNSGYFKFPDGVNPREELENRTMRDRYLRTLANLAVDYDIAKDLHLKVGGGIDYTDRTYDEYRTINLVANPDANRNRNYDMTWNAQAILTYNLDLGSDHSFNFMAGTEVLKFNQESNFTNVTWDQAALSGEPEPILGAPLFNDPFIPEVIRSSNNYRFAYNPLQSYSFLSYFGRVNYMYKSKYLLNANVRADGSSRFGANNKWGFFPAASVGWLLHEEDFLANNSTVSNLKLKAGYGRTGNAEIPNYAQWGTTRVNEPRLYNGNQMIYQDNLANPDLRWESSTTYDLGLEFGLFKQRFTGEIAIYRKDARDLFLNVNVPTSSGWGSVLRNIGHIRNDGIEFSFNANVMNKAVTWDVDFNIARNVNNVMSTGGAPPDALGGPGDVRVLEGYPAPVNYIVKFLYVDPDDGLPVFEGLTKNDAGEVVERFETKTYNADRDRQPVGKPYPDAIGGLNNSFRYKNWDLSILFSFQIGGNIYDDAEKFHMNNLGSWNLLGRVKERWTQPGDVTDVPRVSLGNSGIDRGRNTTEYLHDASFLRLRTLSVGYNLPSEMCTRYGLTSARISLIGSNLLTFSNYHGDPEIFRDMENRQERNLAPNVTYLTPFQARTYSVSLNVQF